MKGGCACGKVRFRSEGEVVESSWCHCRNCQRISGAPAAVYVTAMRDGFSIEAGEDQLGEVNLTAFAKRLFCKNCGSPLATMLDHQPDMIDITATSLDDPAAYPPEFHIHCGSKVSWFKFADDLPKYQGSRNQSQ